MTRSCAAANRCWPVLRLVPLYKGKEKKRRECPTAVPAPIMPWSSLHGREREEKKSGGEKDGPGCGRSRPNRSIIHRFDAPRERKKRKGKRTKGKGGCMNAVVVTGPATPIPLEEGGEKREGVGAAWCVNS